MRIAIGSDHKGFTMRRELAKWLCAKAGGRHRVLDVGCISNESCDYPDYAIAVGRLVSRGRANRGILICRTGVGMAMAANKIYGVRAALSWTPAVAALASEHNNANVLCLPAHFVTIKQARRMIQIFLNTPFGRSRHARRVQKMTELEHFYAGHPH